jgi:putative phosphoesterase
MKQLRLAVLADIHGNLPALETALQEIEEYAVDGFIAAGDMVAGPDPQGVVNRLRDLGGWLIRGNNENYIMRYFSGEAPDYWYTCQQWAFMHWNYRQLDQATLEFLAALPEQRVIHLPGTDPIRVVHGSPRNNAELVYPDRDISLLDIALAQTTEPVLIFGHTHLSWQLRRNGRLALNPGSLSGKFNGQLGGGYALLTWDGGQWQAELRELHYDIDLIRKSYRDSGLLEEGGAIARYFLRDIETGTNSLPRFVDFAWDMAHQAGYAEAPFIPDHIWEQAEILFASELSKGTISL